MVKHNTILLLANLDGLDETTAYNLVADAVDKNTNKKEILLLLVGEKEMNMPIPYTHFKVKLGSVVSKYNDALRAYSEDWDCCVPIHRNATLTNNYNEKIWSSVNFKAYKTNFLMLSNNGLPVIGRVFYEQTLNVFPNKFKTAYIASKYLFKYSPKNKYVLIQEGIYNNILPLNLNDVDFFNDIKVAKNDL